MRYIIVDLEAASKLSFGRLSEARDWADRVSRNDRSLLEELLVERYNERGRKVGESQWADDFLDALVETTTGSRASPSETQASLPEPLCPVHGDAFGRDGTCPTFGCLVRYLRYGDLP